MDKVNMLAQYIENTAETAYTIAKAVDLIDAGEALERDCFR